MRYCLILLFLLFSLQAIGQSNSLADKKVTLTAENKSLPEIFKTIETQIACRFTYPSELISSVNKVTISAGARPLSQVLEVLLPPNVGYQIRGNYIILSKKSVNPTTIVKPSVIYISGYVKEISSDTLVSGASISVTDRMINAATNANGYFRIKIDKPAASVNLKIYKQNFHDTTIAVPALSNYEALIRLRSLDTIKILPEVAPFEDFLIPDVEVLKAQNTSDTVYHDWQIGLLPGVGMYDDENGYAINKYSFNLIGGYSLGTDGVELAGIFNLDRGNVRYAQIAGAANGTGGSVLGGQIAGIANVTAGSVTGMQGAGFVNLIRDSLTGAQVAGYFNLVRRQSKGIQVSGFANSLLDTAVGGQITGFLNYAHREFKGLQVSGYANYMGASSVGGQVSGFANIVNGNLKGSQVTGFVSVVTRKITGAQVSGFSNISVEDVEGVQVAGLFNYAKRLKGVQIGLFNYVDSIDGIPIGLVSYVGNGYHQIEAGSDELNYLQLAFRSGLQKFHTQLTAGIRPDNNDTVSWNFGWGFGTSPSLNKNLLLDIELNGRQLVYGNNFDHIDLIGNVYAGLNWKISRWFSVAAGPQLSAGIRDLSYTGYQERFDRFSPDIIASETVETVKIDLWLGVRAGIRFL